MEIADNILKHYLRNCYFINGTAYAGKSTMCALLAERYGMLHCAENYGLNKFIEIADPALQPNLCYTRIMPSWQAFVLRTPEEYEAWIDGSSDELIGFEIAELIRLSADRKVIVDTNIPCEVLHRISSPNRVAILLSKQATSVERFELHPIC